MKQCLSKGAESWRLAKLRGLPIEAIRSAIADGSLAFGQYRKADTWFIRDQRAGCARRLDGRLWKTREGAVKVLDTPGDSGVRVLGWPIGILHAKNRRDICVCEGGPDLLAAHAVRHALNLDFGIVCLLGGSLSIHEDARAFFSGKRVRFIAQNDETGRNFAKRNAALLVAVSADITIASVESLRTASGELANDLCDVLAFRKPFRVPQEAVALFDFNDHGPTVQVVPQQRELFATPSSPLSPIAKRSLVTEEDREDRRQQTRTEERGEGEEEEKRIEKRARELACTARGQSNDRLFQLARELRGVEERCGGKNQQARVAAFEIWYAKSVPHLDSTKKRSEYLALLLRKLRIVRSPAGRVEKILAKAKERAVAAPQPEIPYAPDAPDEWRLLAAVCRELQQAANEAPFILTKRDAAQVMGKSHPMDGQRALDALEDFGMLQCVSRGDARPGGKAGRYRFLPPIKKETE